MKQIASALVKAQRQRHTPEGRMLEAALLRQFLPQRMGFNHLNGGLPIDRLMRRLAFGASDCWYWIGSTDGAGYGCLPVMGENKAHRAAYRIFKGDIPAGMKVLHDCDTRCCVNPAHLRLGTQADNVADMVSKGRGKSVPLRGEANPASKLTAQSVASARALKAQGVPQKQIATMLGVSQMTISRAVRGESWK